MDVLLVDDSRVMRQLVRRTLRQAGYEVTKITEAENGNDALQKLAAHKPDLVLSDWNMPEMNGIDLLMNMRQRGIKTPLGFITSESTPNMKAKAASEGALFLLTKPFTADDMRSALTGAGIRPHNAGTSSARVVPFSGTFGHKLLSQLLSQLVNLPVSVNPGTKLVSAVTPCVSATWYDDDDNILYAAFCELAVAASFGAAVGLRPATSLTEALRSKTLPEALQGDIREVFNVLSRAFNDCGSVHVRLSEISFPPSPPLGPAREIDKSPAARMDFTVQAQGYASGKLSIVSTAADFILTEVKLTEMKLRAG